VTVHGSRDTVRHLFPITPSHTCPTPCHARVLGADRGVPSDETTDLCVRFMHGLGVRVVLVGRHSPIDQAILVA
jgi:hypothetical protein